MIAPFLEIDRDGAPKKFPYGAAALNGSPPGEHCVRHNQILHRLIAPALCWRTYSILVGAGVKHHRHGDLERFCCFEVDDQFEGRRLRYR
jgi:hypothetical protein